MGAKIVQLVKHQIPLHLAPQVEYEVFISRFESTCKLAVIRSSKPIEFIVIVFFVQHFLLESACVVLLFVLFIRFLVLRRLLSESVLAGAVCSLGEFRVV